TTACLRQKRKIEQNIVSINALGSCLLSMLAGSCCTIKSMSSSSSSSSWSLSSSSSVSTKRQRVQSRQEHSSFLGSQDGSQCPYCQSNTAHPLFVYLLRVSPANL